MDEYIRREDVLMLKNEIGAYGMDISSKDVETLPAADVRENVRGYWKGKPICGRSTVRCSVCDSCFVENMGKWAFCPHCGADMRKEYKQYDS